MDWMNEMGEMVAVDAPEREDAFDAMVDTGIALIRDEDIIAFFTPAPLWGADMGDEIAALLKK
jgi:hypothetical protein